MTSSNGQGAEPGNTPENQWEYDIVSTAHPRVQSRIEKWLRKIEDQQLQKIENPRIPVEIIFQIIELLLNDHDECTAVCVAITGRAYYRFFRSVHPEHVLLISRPPYPYSPKGFPPSLAKLLHESLVPNYRFSKRLHQYLLCSVYGDEAGSDKEWDLIQQTRDYRSIKSRQGHTVGKLILPNPFGMGTDWYLAAVRQFVKHVEEAVPDLSTVGSNLMQYVPVVMPGISVIGLTMSTFTSTGLPVRLVNMASLPDTIPWLHGIPYPAVTSTGHIIPGQTMLGQTPNQDQLRENLRMTNLAVKDQYARVTAMRKTHLWHLMGKYINTRILDYDSNGNVLEKTRRMCFWEAIVHASKQDWEQFFLLLADGVEITKSNELAGL
ncbi:uncharacterized protein EAF01_011574 [Botrytis porri]|uniref:Uncharacterized protein n=1 Tax=Botrytis porri TaxID=87229 RepID=A0A4Z1KF23_9HELO|nr:uncharacterized protein EAF01_011574 [Botrytis porri]KAF7884151.1 hypothetical protein EAF01_011574 [Botrytis porri]TGO82792.1 hypothetical protein BPOR_0758g00040 [Botrytis porri]